MNNKINSKHLLFFLLLASVFILDRLTKTFLAKESCAFLFCIKPSVNHGAVFGIFPGSVWLLVIITLIILFIAILLFRTKDAGKSRLMQFALILIIAGTLGNLFDRIMYGYVIDWLTFSFFKFPSFNLADVANLCGVILIIIKIFKDKG
jgi:signal peptidase II